MKKVISGEYNVEHGKSMSNIESESNTINYSYKRISDSLMENILSYLTFSEKVIYESVSKQWQRVVFNQQMKLELKSYAEEERVNTLNKLLKPTVVCDYSTGFVNNINFKSIKKSSLISVLKKCKNVNEITFECYCDGEDLEIIGKYCPHLKTFNTYPFGFNENNLNDFGLKYGNGLKNITINNSQFGCKFHRNLYKHCNNLIEIKTKDTKAYICDEKDFLPNLKAIHDFEIHPENISDLEIISKKYSQTLEELCLVFYSKIGFKPKFGLSLICNLKNLRKLLLYCDVCDSEPNFENILVELSQNCSQLNIFELSINNYYSISQNFFDSFKKFENLVKFDLSLFNTNKKIYGNVECFKFNKNLKHFRIFFDDLNDTFFKDIDMFLPNLTVLDIETLNEFNDQTINYFSRLKNLREFYLSIESSNKSITDTSICQLINNCSDIEIISFNSRPNITEITIETLISKALLKPKINLNFFCGFSSAGDELEFSQIDLNSFEDRIPINLEIIIV